MNVVEQDKGTVKVSGVKEKVEMWNIIKEGWRSKSKK